MGRALGVDFGLKRIGLALSDEGKRIASPFTTLATQRSTAKTLDLLFEAIADRDVDEIAVGHPIRLSGKMSLMADEVAHFVSRLKERFEGKVVLIDERLVSMQVERAMKEDNVSRKKRSKVVDTLSAVVILQTHLSQQRPLEY